MIERPLPEAVRGSWYFLPEKGAPEEALEDEGKILATHIDGRFVRYELDSVGAKEPDTEGDYTFDGDFLILRGSKTETYRVRIEESWYWVLEGKRKSRRLYRGLFDETSFFEMDEATRAQIARLPMRVHVDCPFVDETDAIFDLVYRGDDAERRVGSFSVEIDQELDALWVGLTPLATNVAPETWRKVIEKSYLQVHPGSPEDIEHVRIELLGTDESVEFSAG